MRYFITGNKGQLGSAITKRLTEDSAAGGDLPEFDITNYAATRAAVETSNADVVIHCAAFTNVDGCAENPAEDRKHNVPFRQIVKLRMALFQTFGWRALGIRDAVTSGGEAVRVCNGHFAYRRFHSGCPRGVCCCN